MTHRLVSGLEISVWIFSSSRETPTAATAENAVVRRQAQFDPRRRGKKALKCSRYKNEGAKIVDGMSKKKKKKKLAGLTLPRAYRRIGRRSLPVRHTTVNFGP